MKTLLLSLSYAVLTWGEPFESPLWDSRSDAFAYVCRDFACQQPTDAVDTLRTQLG